VSGPNAQDQNERQKGKSDGSEFGRGSCQPDVTVATRTLMSTQLSDSEFDETAIPTRLGPRSGNLGSVLAFAGGVALVLLYALRGGGS